MDMPPTTLAAPETVLQSDAQALCPRCRAIFPARVVARDGRVYLDRSCSRHGPQVTLLSSDADWYVRALRFDLPATPAATPAMAVTHGCPDDCGLCPEHQQHTCLAVMEVTQACNLRCPTCFTSAGEVPATALRLAQVDFMLDRLLTQEPGLQVLQVSGGEPTVHPEIAAILRAAHARGIAQVMLNTNGLRLGEDQELVDTLAAIHAAVYFQFDGLEAQTSVSLRGLDLRRKKVKALDRLAATGVPVVLVATVVRGVNDHELGAVVQFGLEHPAVRGVNFQPSFHEGRHLPAFDAAQRITLPDVIHGIVAQTGQRFVRDDFVPVPCCHPNCMAVCWSYVDQGAVLPLARLLDPELHAPLLANRALPDAAAGIPRLLAALELVTVTGPNGAPCIGCEGICVPLPDPSEVWGRLFNIQVTGFMDRYNLELTRLRKCCVHEILPDGRLVPFCAYNTAGYREQVAAAPAAQAQG